MKASQIGALSGPGGMSFKPHRRTEFLPARSHEQARGPRPRRRGQHHRQPALPGRLTIRERLATTDPDNAGYQRDLSISHNRLGDLADAELGTEVPGV